MLNEITILILLGPLSGKFFALFSFLNLVFGLGKKHKPKGKPDKITNFAKDYILDIMLNILKILLIMHNTLLKNLLLLYPLCR